MTTTITFEQGTGFNPRIVRIVTTSTFTQVTTAGWLDSAVHNEGFSILPSDKLLIYYDTNGTPGNAFFDVSISAGVITLSVSETNVVTPTIANHIAVFTNASGTISDDAATAINGGNIQAGLSGTAGYLASFPATLARGSLRLTAVANTGDTLVTVSNAAHGQASVYSIPDGGQATSNFIISNSAGTQTIATGSLSVAAGNISAGSSGNAGTLTSFPTTAANGSLIISALNAGGAFNTTIRNSVMGQSSVISIPDPGAATANFILSANASGQTITSGSLTVAGALSSTSGNVTSGSSGDAGTFISFPATAANGTLIIAAANAGAAFNTTISNDTMGQSSIYTIPDVGNAAGRFLVGATATPFTSGNFPVASGTGGLMVDSGLAAANIQNKTNIIANSTADIGGGGAGPISVVVAGLTAASKIVATIASSTNTVSVAKCIATATGFDITFSGDPGAACVVNYVAFIAAQ